LPRERIHIAPSSDFGVQVGWQREGGVQVGVEPLVGNVATDAGLWSDLDRQGCNDLIRILRRARDSAFGRDE